MKPINASPTMTRSSHTVLGVYWNIPGSVETANTMNVEVSSDE